MSSIEKITSSNKVTLDPKDKVVRSENKKSSSHAPKHEKREKSEKPIPEKKLEKAIEETNRIVFGDNERFEFKIHEGTGRYLVRLVDNETKETIREIPPEKILDLIANIWEMVGILVDERG